MGITYVSESHSFDAVVCQNDNYFRCWVSVMNGFIRVRSTQYDREGTFPFEGDFSSRKEMWCAAYNAINSYLEQCGEPGIDCRKVFFSLSELHVFTFDVSKDICHMEFRVSFHGNTISEVTDVSLSDGFRELRDADAPITERDRMYAVAVDMLDKAFR